MTYGKRGLGLSPFWLCVCGALALAGCAPAALLVDPWEAERRSSFVQASAADAWLSVPSAQLVLGRSGRGWREQKILLSNETVLPGDNFVFLRAAPPGVPTRTKRFELEAVVRAAGGIPEPFTDDDLRFLKSTSDEAGALIYASSNTGAGVSCVLAFRGLDASQRALPGRAARLEIMMRNCVEGSEADALAELQPRYLGFATPMPDAANTVTSLSPLARPYQ